MRRGRLQQLALGGMAIPDLMKVSGHKQESTLLRYLGWGATERDARDRVIQHTLRATNHSDQRGGGEHDAQEWWFRHPGCAAPPSTAIAISKDLTENKKLARDTLHIKKVGPYNQLVLDGMAEKVGRGAPWQEVTKFIRSGEWHEGVPIDLLLSFVHHCRVLRFVRTFSRLLPGCSVPAVLRSVSSSALSLKRLVGSFASIRLVFVRTQLAVHADLSSCLRCRAPFRSSSSLLPLLLVDTHVHCPTLSLLMLMGMLVHTLAGCVGVMPAPRCGTLPLLVLHPAVCARCRLLRVGFAELCGLAFVRRRPIPLGIRSCSRTSPSPWCLRRSHRRIPVGMRLRRSCYLGHSTHSSVLSSDIVSSSDICGPLAINTEQLAVLNATLISDARTLAYAFRREVLGVSKSQCFCTPAPRKGGRDTRLEWVAARTNWA